MTVDLKTHEGYMKMVDGLQDLVLGLIKRVESLERDAAIYKISHTSEGTPRLTISEWFSEACNMGSKMYSALPGVRGANILENNFDYYDQIENMGYDDFLKVSGCGPKTAKEILEMIYAYKKYKSQVTETNNTLAISQEKSDTDLGPTE